MRKGLISAVSVILAAVLVISGLTLSASAAGGISYSFEGSSAGDKGCAQGTIKVSADSSSAGSYTLYWADDSAALSGFDPICTLNVAASSSASFNMPAYTAIPAQATKVIGFRGAVPSGMSVSSAAAVYDIPENKRLNRSKSDMLYSFAAYSDIHITSDDDDGGARYPYDEQHLADAFKTAADRDVDFIVTTGDHVNNQRSDSKGNGNPFYPNEWNRYLRILADSDYVNPIYEAIGNHELWAYENSDAGVNLVAPFDWKTGSDYFSRMTGLDSSQSSLNSGKAYYEITEPKTGDHFLFMALEGGFYTDANNEFSDEQLSWLDSKLTQYENDGKNIFIMEHANFDRWGAGDRLNNPLYDIPLKDSCTATAKLKALLQKHKSPVMITGHTHFRFSLQLNYSTNNQTSAAVIHNSAVGGVRDIVNGARYNDKSRELTEGYIVEVYDDATIFYGTNLYRNKIDPSASYIVPQTTSSIEPEPTQAPTQEPTQAPKHIDAVDITVSEPEAGRALEYTAAVSDSDCRVFTELTGGFWKDGMLWYDNNASFVNPSGSTAEAGHRYEVRLMIAPKDGYKLDNDTVLTVNGNPATRSRDADYPENYYVRYTLPAVPEPATEAPTQPATQEPTQAPEPGIVYGDADGDEIVTIMDVTVIQRWLLGTWELDEDAVFRAAVSGEDELTIVDATIIQRYLLGIIEIFPAESGAPLLTEQNTPVSTRSKDPELADTGADLNTLRSQAETALDKYWLLSSYDQYQALKKAYKLNYGYDLLKAAYTDLNAAAAAFYPGDSITVYFTNNLGWKNVYAYCSAGHGKDKNHEWGGLPMDYYDTNEYGEKRYSITVPIGKYCFIIFNNYDPKTMSSTQQTIDLPLGVTPNQGFYYSSKLGKDSQGRFRCLFYKVK